MTEQEDKRLRSYRAKQTAPVRDYLHIVLHCIYRHMFIGASVDRPFWGLACDIAVENIIAELNLRATDMWRFSAQQADLNKDSLVAFADQQSVDQSKYER